MSEVRKAQTYGRDPRNGHSTIYCISKAGTIYQASEPMYELLMQNMRALEQVGRGETCDRRDDSPTKADAGPARRQPRAERSRACSSRPCVVVGAEPAVRRSASLLDLRRRCAAARRGIRGVLPVLSSSSPVVDVTLGGALPPRRRRGRASRGGLRGGRRQPRAGRRAASEGCAAPLLGLPLSSWHQCAERRARRSTTSTSSRATSDGLASVARLLYALVALGLAYIRCVENVDDPRPVLELPVGPQNAPFCSFRCRASERSMCGGWGGCEESGEV